MGGTSVGCPNARSELPQPQLMFPSCLGAGDPLTGGGSSELEECGGEDFWDDGVECQAVHTQDPCICPWSVKVLQDVVLVPC